jgi:arylformamidase
VPDVIDVSLTLAGDMLVWPGDPPAEIIPRIQLSKGDPANVSELRIGTHTGTHVDPPVHFIEGTHGIDRVPPDVLVGPALVAHLPEANGPLGPTELDALSVPGGTARLLLKTSNSNLWRQPKPLAFPDTYACLSADGAAWVIEHGIQLIGVDFLSIEQRGAEGHPAHKALLSNGVVIVEGLDLGAAEPGSYTLACLPLKILDGDGGPARAVLLPA